MKSPTTVRKLEDLGRVQLSESYFMRDFLYSEISQIEMIPNTPDYPDVAIEAGRNWKNTQPKKPERIPIHAPIKGKRYIVFAQSEKIS